MSDVIGIIGVGYVGLSLALKFGVLYDTLAYDISESKIRDLRDGIDRTGEWLKSDFTKASKLQFTFDTKAIARCNVYVITVGTPVTTSGRPDLKELISACEVVGSVVSIGNVVVIESTVYPGATIEVCVPKIEAVSGLKYPNEFSIAYSPERLSPGAGGFGVEQVTKVVAADEVQIADWVSSLYRTIIPAGVYVAKSIAVAEAAKVVENTQRDLNIALMNELSIVFKNLGVNIYDVIEAASTKWNFHAYTPGLVGGHCISVDPYYLLYKSESLGYSPNLIHTSRRINEGMPMHVANLATKFFYPGARLLIIGFTFKANCSDIRNTKVFDLYTELLQRGFFADIYDSMADKSEAYRVYGVKLNDHLNLRGYTGVIYAVDHSDPRRELLKAINALNVPVLDLTGRLRDLIDQQIPYETL